MTPYERYIFEDKCPYTNDLCYKDIACVNCEVNTHEKEDAEELDRAESEDKCINCANNGMIDDECAYCTNHNLFKAESEG